MTPRCENCSFARVGYASVETTMAELRCVKASSKGRSIYWAFDTFRVGCYDTNKLTKGIDEVQNFVRSQKVAPNWCPLRKSGAGRR